jgi:TPR repeat protein
MRLNYSSYEGIFIKFLNRKISKPDLAVMLFSSVFGGKEGATMNPVRDSDHSRYRGGTLDIKDSLRQHYIGSPDKSDEEIAVIVKQSFGEIIKSMKQEREHVDALLSRYCELIQSDASIPNETRNRFLRLAVPETLSDFLAETFIYAVRQNNKIEKQESAESSHLQADEHDENDHPIYFTRGDDSNEDYNKAIQLYEQGDMGAVGYFYSAANNNDACAIAFLGYMYQNGDYVEQDYAMAIAWWERFIAISPIPSDTSGLGLRCWIDFNLGNLYSFGLGVDQDYARAFEYYLSSAKGGNLLAAQILGDFYRDGLGTTQDYEQAIKWYAKVAVVEVDELQEVEILNNCTDHISKAQYQLALLYKEGLGVVRNSTKTIEWFTRAALNGHKEAKIELELLHAFGAFA